jgi:hypothetical protein
MVASPEPTVTNAPSPTALALAPRVPEPEHGDQSALAAQVRAERNLVRSVVTGMAIGAVVCAAIWVGIVALATVGAGPALLPLFAVGAVCGVLAGIFLGGSAGALAGARGLEHVEHERMHGSA